MLSKPLKRFYPYNLSANTFKWLRMALKCEIEDIIHYEDRHRNIKVSDFRLRM